MPEVLPLVLFSEREKTLLFDPKLKNMELASSIANLARTDMSAPHDWILDLQLQELVEEKHPDKIGMFFIIK
jgi:hypothetical protein